MFAIVLIKFLLDFDNEILTPYEFLLFPAQSQMMSRGFYPPIHSALYSGAFGANSKAYSLSGLSNNAGAGGGNASSNSGAGGGSFGYPPTPPKDSGTPDISNMNNNNNNSQVNGQDPEYHSGGSSTPDGSLMGGKMDIKAEYLMSSINQLSNYAASGSYGAAGAAGVVGRKLPEGGSSYGMGQGGQGGYGGYSSSDLAMYYRNPSSAAHHLPKSKTKSRTNAGRTTNYQSDTNKVWKIHFRL